MASKVKRAYVSARREKSAALTKKRVQAAAASLFARRGIDAVTIAEIAERAEVSASSVYALYGSKEGVLYALLESTLFGASYRAAATRLDGVEEPIARLAMTASVARAIYESESEEIAIIRGASSFSAALRRLEQGLEERRYELQEERVTRLHAAGLLTPELTLEKARRLVWMYTARDVYRLLVLEGGFTNDEYEAWLAATLVSALVRGRVARRPNRTTRKPPRRARSRA